MLFHLISFIFGIYKFPLHFQIINHDIIFLVFFVHKLKFKLHLFIKLPVFFLAHLHGRLKWAFLITICLFCIVVVVVLNFSLFHLLQNHLTNFNQTWHRVCPWVKGNKGPRLFPRGDNYKIAKKTLTNFKNCLLHNQWANFNQTWYKLSWVKGIQFCSKEGPHFSKGRWFQYCKNTLMKFSNIFLQNHLANFNQIWHKAYLVEVDSSMFN